jgi:hypothetical protein
MEKFVHIIFWEAKSLFFTRDKEVRDDSVLSATVEKEDRESDDCGHGR